MSEESYQEYDDSFVNLLELVWGDGYLSPGGPDEVRRIIGNHDLTDKTILDIGCGSGGIDRLLVSEFNAKYVVGIDTESSLIEKCNDRKSQISDHERLEFIQVKPGKLPFSDCDFDIVFTKDSLVHVENKADICGEVFRVLRPGGRFLASDWMCSEKPHSELMQKYIESEGLDFGMGMQDDYQIALDEAGFTNVEFINRNAWYTEQAQIECQRLSTELYPICVDMVGQDLTDREIETWKAMIEVLKSGELCPTHWCAEKR